MLSRFVRDVEFQCVRLQSCSKLRHCTVITIRVRLFRADALERAFNQISGNEGGTFPSFVSRDTKTTLCCNNKPGAFIERAWSFRNLECLYFSDNVRTVANERFEIHGCLATLDRKLSVASLTVIFVERVFTGSPRNRRFVRKHLGNSEREHVHFRSLGTV